LHDKIREVFEVLGGRSSREWKGDPEGKQHASLPVGNCVVYDTHKLGYLQAQAPDYSVALTGRCISSFNTIFLIELQVLLYSVVFEHCLLIIATRSAVGDAKFAAMKTFWAYEFTSRTAADGGGLASSLLLHHAARATKLAIFKQHLS
jgi:hypothetical protein